MVLRWRGAKNIGIYGVFLFREREKSRKHRLFDAFWGFAKTAYLTIFGGLQKVPTTKRTTTTTTGPSSNSNNNNNNNNDDDTTTTTTTTTTMTTTTTTRTTTTTTTLSLSLPRPLQASPVCEALQYVLDIYIPIWDRNFTRLLIINTSPGRYPHYSTWH